MTRSSEIEHTADRAFTVRGASLRELFEHAAQVLLEMQEVLQGGSSVSRELSCSGVDGETLLVNFLNEVLYFQEIHGETYQRCEVLEISGTELRARFFGVTGPARRPVKAVTFHNLRIEITENGLEATIVVDV